MTTSGGKPSRFLNVDLELESPDDLSPIAAHWGERVNVLYAGPGGPCFRLSLELADSGFRDDDALQLTCAFLDLIDALPEDLLLLWRGCSRRDFDYGFEGTGAAIACIEAKCAARMSTLGIGIRVSVYPFLAR